MIKLLKKKLNYIVTIFASKTLNHSLKTISNYSVYYLKKIIVLLLISFKFYCVFIFYKIE